MSITAHDGPSDGPHGHFFSRGSIKLRSLLVSAWVLPWGEQLCCVPPGTQSSVEAARHPSGQYCFTGLADSEVSHLRVPWRGLFCQSSNHLFTVTHSSCLFGLTPHTGNNMPLEGEKMFPVWRKSSSCSFPAPRSSENSNAGNSLFRFCIRWTGKSWVIFLHTIHPDQKKFKITVRWICWACANSGLGN